MDVIIDERLRERLAADEFSALASYCQGAECSIQLVKWLGGSGSDIKLAEVRIDDRDRTRRSVLKYCPSDGTPGADYLAFKRAEKMGPRRFVAAHLAAIDRGHDKPILNGTDGLFILMEPRHSEQVGFDTLAALPDQLPKACKTVTTSILKEWNGRKARLKYSDQAFTATEYLRSITKNGCEPDGPIRQAAEYLGISAAEPTLPGQLLPNPIVAVAAAQGHHPNVLDETFVTGICGNAHGDLHQDNILVPLPHTDQEPPHNLFTDYVLIDLTNYGNDKMIAVDPVHLLLSIIARRLREVPVRQRYRLQELILAPEVTVPGRLQGDLTDTVRAVHAAGTAFARERGLHREWLLETCIATAGCALLFVGRDLPEDDRRWFLELAALALERVEILREGSPAGSAGLVIRPGPGLPEGRERPSAVANHADDQQEDWETEPGPPKRPAQRTPKVTHINPSSEPRHKVQEDPGAAPNQAIIESAEAFRKLADELGAEISRISANHPSGGPAHATAAVTDILAKFSSELTQAQDWQRQHRSEWNITYGTAIGALRTQVNRLTVLVSSLGEVGTDPDIWQDIDQALQAIQRFIQKGMLFRLSGQPPDP